MTQKRIMVPLWTMPITISAYTNAGIQIGAIAFMLAHHDSAASFVLSVLFLLVFSAVATGFSVYIWQENKK